MKELKLNKEVTNRLQDEEMAKLVGAASASNTSSGKAQKAMTMEESEKSSCCQKSCN